jgi:hypothetical protein
MLGMENRVPLDDSRISALTCFFKMLNNLKKFFDQRGSIVYLFLLLVLPFAIGGTGYFMCLEQKTSLESAFEREADGILHNLEELGQYHISSFDWPPIEELQQRTISNPTVSAVWIEDMLSHRHFGEQKRV